MGIEGLLPFLRAVAPNSVRKTRVSDYTKFRTMAVDANVNLYAFMYVDCPAVFGMLRLALLLHHHGIHPLFVFDGPHGQLKTKTKIRRDAILAATRQNLQEKLSKPGDHSVLDLQKAEQRTRKPGIEDKNTCIRVLTAMGIAAIQAPGESDLLIAALYRHKVVDGVFTTDSDLIVHGVDPVACNISVFSRTGEIEEFSATQALKDLGISNAQFIDLSCMSGSDYTDAVKNVKPRTAYKMIKEHGSIEAFRAWTVKEKKTHYYVFPDDDDFPIAEARLAFSTDDPASLAMIDSVKEMLATRQPTSIAASLIMEAEPLINAPAAEWIAKTWSQMIVKGNRVDWRLPEALSASVRLPSQLPENVQTMLHGCMLASDIGTATKRPRRLPRAAPIQSMDANLMDMEQDEPVPVQVEQPSTRPLSALDEIKRAMSLADETPIISEQASFRRIRRRPKKPADDPMDLDPT